MSLQEMFSVLRTYHTQIRNTQFLFFLQSKKLYQLHSLRNVELNYYESWVEKDAERSGQGLNEGNTTERNHETLI